MDPAKPKLTGGDAWQTVVYANDQPEYRQLPALKAPDGTVICAWRLSLRERIWLLLTGRLYIALLTFNQPLQPVLPMAAKPILANDGTFTELK